jgi:hypothetical protein
MLSRKEEAKQLIRAQRLAKRTRASAACLPCKAKKAKCNDYRPCARCQRSPGEECIDENPEITSTMYPANLTGAFGVSGFNVSTHEARPFQVAAVSDAPRSGHSDALDAFTGAFADHGHGTAWEGAFPVTRFSQVCIRPSHRVLFRARIREW